MKIHKEALQITTREYSESNFQLFIRCRAVVKWDHVFLVVITAARQPSAVFS